MSFRNFNLRKNQAQKVGKIEPALNIHTPLSCPLTPIFLFARLQRSSKKKLFLSRKNTGGKEGIVPLLLLQVTPMPF
jgi:hypothetical protein